MSSIGKYGTTGALVGTLAGSLLVGPAGVLTHAAAGGGIGLILGAAKDTFAGVGSSVGKVLDKGIELIDAGAKFGIGIGFSMLAYERGLQNLRENCRISPLDYVCHYPKLTDIAWMTTACAVGCYSLISLGAYVKKFAFTPRNVEREISCAEANCGFEKFQHAAKGTGLLVAFIGVPVSFVFPPAGVWMVLGGTSGAAGVQIGKYLGNLINPHKHVIYIAV